MFFLAPIFVLSFSSRNQFTKYPATGNLKQDIDQIYNLPDFQGASIGCKVIDNDGKVLYERNSSMRLVPASNNKLFATSYAFATFNLALHLGTRFWNEKDGLYIQSNGNPLVSVQDIGRAKARLHSPANSTVYLDEAYAPGYNEDWEFGDLPNQYAAPVTAITVDRGILYLWNNNGTPTLLPAAFGTKIDWTKRNDPTVSDTFDIRKNVIHLYGKLANESKMIDNLAIPEPDIAFGSYFGKHIRFTNHVPTRQPDYVIIGQSIEATMRLCLQESDNNLAENFLFIAATHDDASATTWPLAIKHLNHFLVKVVGLSPTEINEDDGSGLSRENNISTSAICDLMLWHLKQANIALWRSLLDHPGSGTLVTRLAQVPFQGKTGTMNRVSALSGYLNLSGTKTVVISLIEDNYQCTTQKMKQLENQIATIIYQDTRK